MFHGEEDTKKKTHSQKTLKLRTNAIRRFYWKHQEDLKGFRKTQQFYSSCMLVMFLVVILLRLNHERFPSDSASSRHLNVLQLLRLLFNFGFVVWRETAGRARSLLAA